jgi:hypothetical protein
VGFSFFEVVERLVRLGMQPLEVLGMEGCLWKKGLETLLLSTLIEMDLEENQTVGLLDQRWVEEKSLC